MKTELKTVNSEMRIPCYPRRGCVTIMEKYPIKLTVPNCIVSDKKELTKYVWAFTLGDGCIRIQLNKNRANRDVNYHFECGQIAEHEDYILWRADILSNITSVLLQYKVIKNGKPQIHTQTGRHPFFTTIRTRTYLNNHKVISEHDLKLLDWETLAILYQDDGSLSKKPVGNTCYTLSLATDSFSYGDNILLQRAIKEKVDILFRVNKLFSKSTGNLYHRLILSRYDTICRFLDGVSKFIKPSFEYKLLPNAQLLLL